MSPLIERTEEYNAADSTLKETDVRVTSTIELKCLTWQKALLVELIKTLFVTFITLSAPVL